MNVPFSTQEPIATRVARALRDADAGIDPRPPRPDTIHASTAEEMRSVAVKYIEAWMHEYARCTLERTKAGDSSSEIHRHAMASNVCEMLARHLREAEITSAPAPVIPLHPASKPRAPLNFDPSTAYVGALLAQSLQVRK